MTADVLYFAHIIIKFYVGYIQEGTLIANRKFIRNKYLSRTNILLFWYNFGISTGCCRAVFSGNKPSYQWHIFQKYEGLRRILRFQAVITFFGKYEDHLGPSTKSIRSFKYFLIAYTLIHCISYGWHMLLCPNKSVVDVLNSMTMDGLYLKNKIWRVLQHCKICQMFILGYNHFNIQRIWRYTCCQWEWEVVLCG